MNQDEIFETLLKGGKGETVKADCSKADLLAAMRDFKSQKIPLMGGIELIARYKGTNIRKIDVADAKAVANVFNVFTSEYKGTDKCRKPIIDAEHDGLVSSDGWKMLVCRIPQKFPIGDALPNGFTNEIAFSWSEIAGEIEPSDYNLSAYRRMATVQKGSALHGFLQAGRAAVSAYAFEDDEGFYHTFYLKVGKKFYDATGVANLVDALYKLGCTSVDLCEKTAWSGSHVMEHTPLHIYGFGADMDAKGVIMPLRYADDSMGAFVMPLDEVAGRKKVA